MKKFKKVLAVLLVCALALCTLAACGDSKNNSLRKDAIAKINASRTASYMNALEESSVLDDEAEKAMDIYIAKIKAGDSDDEAHDAAYTSVSDKVTISGKTIYTYFDLQYATKGSTIDAADYAGEDVRALYIGASAEELNNKVYYVIILGDVNPIDPF